ncbi:hypothetical protein KKF34_20140 [Myxococcota bacterium]|nr:hypothetical protein [Myxococcota bacterium]MBU1382388.1 hypothetical protein [Myxococcota bacterium]MBU1499200.1 hypothetical protein [Myxococcota bacterium]
MNTIEYNNVMFEKMRNLEKAVKLSMGDQNKIDEHYANFISEIKKIKNPLESCVK